MKNSLNKLLNYFDNLRFSYKTSFLVFIIAGGMICMIILFQISIFTIKSDFDTLFEKRTQSLIKLENIKDTYKVNIQDTLKDLEDKNINFNQAREVLQLASQLITKNWEQYQKLTTEKKDTIISTFIKKYIINEIDYDNKLLKENIIKNIDTKMLQIKSILNSLEEDRNSEYYSNINLQVNALNIYTTSLINYDLSVAINEKRYR